MFHAEHFSFHCGTSFGEDYFLLFHIIFCFIPGSKARPQHRLEIFLLQVTINRDKLKNGEVSLKF